MSLFSDRKVKGEGLTGQLNNRLYAGRYSTLLYTTSGGAVRCYGICTVYKLHHESKNVRVRGQRRN